MFFKHCSVTLVCFWQGPIVASSMSQVHCARLRCRLIRGKLPEEHLPLNLHRIDSFHNYFPPPSLDIRLVHKKPFRGASSSQFASHRFHNCFPPPSCMQESTGDKFSNKFSHHLITLLVDSCLSLMATNDSPPAGRPISWRL